MLVVPFAVLTTPGKCFLHAAYESVIWCSLKLPDLVSIWRKTINILLSSITVKLLNIKNTFGQLHLFFVRRLSSLGGSECIRTIGKNYFETTSCVLCEKFIVLFPYLGELESTIRGSIVFHFTP